MVRPHGKVLEIVLIYIFFHLAIKKILVKYVATIVMCLTDYIMINKIFQGI